MTSLKGSIETLKLSLEEVLSEKTDVIGKLSGMEDSMAQIKADHKKLQESYENSLEDLKTMPEFKAIQNLVQRKEEEILHQQGKLMIFNSFFHYFFVFYSHKRKKILRFVSKLNTQISQIRKLRIQAPFLFYEIWCH